MKLNASLHQDTRAVERFEVTDCVLKTCRTVECLADNLARVKDGYQAHDKVDHSCPG